MSDFFTLDLIGATLRMSTPLILAAMGGLISERAGVMNIALEGMMLIGAFFAVAGTYWTGTPWLGVIIGMLAAMVAGLVHAVWCVTLRGDQIVAGTAINLIAVGLTAFMVQRIWGRAGGSDQVEKLPSILGLNVLIVVAIVVVPLVHVYLFKTKRGLHSMASGESPQAAESVGINVTRNRYIAVIASGAFAGLGGAFLSIGNLNYFTLDMTTGRGFIALAAVIFGGWTPFGAAAASLLFGAAQATQIQAQATQSLPISTDLLVALPYILTLIAVTGLVRTSHAPAGLGKHASAH